MPEARTFTVAEDDDGIRLDRWFKRHMPEVSFNIVSRWARTGQLRLDGKQAVPGDRIEAGQEIRVPPLEAAPARSARPQPKREPLTADEEQFVRDMVIHRDPHAFVLNKPPGLATQGGTKTTQHLDRLLDGLADERRPAQARPPARQGYVGRAAGGAERAGGGAFRQGLFGPDRAQGLLGAGRRRSRRRGGR